MGRSKIFFKRKYYSMFISSSIAYFVSFVSTIIDSTIGGRFLGETAVSAITIVAPLYTVIMFLGEFFSQGTSTIYSQEAGKFELKKAHEIFGVNLVVAFFLGLMFMLGMIVFQDFYLDIYGCSDVVRTQASAYYDYYKIVALIFPSYWIIYNIVFTDGDEKTCTISDIFNAVINLIVSVATVKTMGIAGLGLGTAAGNLSALFILCTHFFKKRNSVKFRFKLHKKELFSSLYIGISSSISYLFIAALEVIMNKFVVLKFTDLFLPAYAIVGLMMNLFTVLTSPSYSAAPMICVYYGEENPVGMKRVIYQSFKTAAFYGVILLIVLELGAPLIPQLYGITTPEVLAASNQVVRICSSTMLFTAFLYVLLYYYPAVGHASFSIILSLNFMFVGPVLWGIVFANFIGFAGISLGTAITPIGALLICWALVRNKYGNKAFPWILPESNYNISIFDITLTENEIMGLLDNIEEALKSENVSSKIINEIRLLTEEVYMLIKEKNEGKNILSECSILVNDERVKLIIKDNGMVFDITDANSDIKSMRSYIVACLMEREEDATYQTTTSFNRNSFCFER